MESRDREKETAGAGWIAIEECHENTNCGTTANRVQEKVISSPSVRPEYSHDTAMGHDVTLKGRQNRIWTGTSFEVQRDINSKDLKVM
jgi:hypothetical protein